MMPPAQSDGIIAVCAGQRRSGAMLLFRLHLLPGGALLRPRRDRGFSVARLVLVLFLLCEGRSIGKFWCALAVRLFVRFAMWPAVRFALRLEPIRIARAFALTFTMITVADLAPRRVGPLFRCRRPLWRIRHRLETDIVFLVRTLDLHGEGFRDPLGNFELGRGVHDLDRADIVLVDAATAADHRQQPARFRVLFSSDVGPEPDAAICHAMLRRRFSRFGSSSFGPIIATRRADIIARRARIVATAILAGPAAPLAGIHDVFGRRQPRAIEPCE